MPASKLHSSQQLVRTGAVAVNWWRICTAPVQEVYFVKENTTATERHIPYSAHLREVSVVSSFALYTAEFSLLIIYTRALQPVATCRQSPYLRKPAIIIVTSFSLW